MGTFKDLVGECGEKLDLWLPLANTILRSCLAYSTRHLQSGVAYLFLLFPLALQDRGGYRFTGNTSGEPGGSTGGGGCLTVEEVPNKRFPRFNGLWGTESEWGKVSNFTKFSLPATPIGRLWQRSLRTSAKSLT